ncbi:MAG: prepilin-type N-terminal cleavage/methylation domain-containing protein [Sideroxydans sp.]|nr:prepilin-type N-terminal cleavage/methylation domain-containing protein [Sideroxydans sp.]
MKSNKGFTLIELVLAVAILGILTAIAMPTYSDYVIRGKLPEGPATLANSRIQIEQHFQDKNGSYIGWTCPSDTLNFTYSCAIAKDTYTITATGKGTVADFSYSINVLNEKKTLSLKAGWGTPGSCWITSKGGTC